MVRGEACIIDKTFRKFCANNYRRVSVKGAEEDVGVYHRR